MDNQDQRNSTPGHEIHGVYICHKCGWPFPNAHPSAKHRRAHKRICGTIEGYKLIDSGDRTHSGLSDDEHGSDEDRRTPSPKTAKGSTSVFTSGGVGERSNRSEDDLFSDAVTEFSDNAFSPAYAEQLEGTRVSNKNVENVVAGDLDTDQQLKVDATAGFQLQNSPADSSQRHNPKVLETETNLLGNAIPVEDIISSCDSELLVSSTNRTDLKEEENNLSDIQSETSRELPREDGKENFGDHDMQSSKMFFEQETDVKGNEESNVDEILSDAAVTPNKTASGASEVACKLEETDLKTSDSLSVSQNVEPKEEQSDESGPLMSLHALSPEVKSTEHMEVSVNATQMDSCSAQDRDVSSCSDLVEPSTGLNGSKNVHVISVANDIPAIEHPEILIEGFKDHKARESSLLVTLVPGEVIEPASVENKNNFSEEKSCESTHISSLELDALKGNLKQEDEGNRVLVPELPVEKGADTSVLEVSSKQLWSNGVEAPQETSTTGNIQTESPTEVQKPRDFDTDSSQDILPESTMGHSDVISVISADEVSHEANFSGGNNACNGEEDKNEKCETDEKESMELINELSTNKRTALSVDDLSVLYADQTINLFGASDSGDHDKAGNEFRDLVLNERRDVAVQEKPEMNSKTTIESPCSLSESKEAVDHGMNIDMNNLQEAETTACFVPESSEVAPDTSNLGILVQNHAGLQNQQDEDSQEAMKEPMFSSTKEVLGEIVNVACNGAESNHDSAVKVSQKIAEIPPEHFPVESDITMKSPATVDDKHSMDGGFGASGITIENRQEEGHENLTKQPIEVPAVDISVDSSSQTDSLEGNWGSVSGAVLSTQSDAVAAIDAAALLSTTTDAPAQSEKVNLEKPETISEGHHSNKSDVFEAPSFMTLVESREMVDQKATSSDIQTLQDTQQQKKSEALQAGWFPSLTNVVNESQGRKKNEEIIAKVTNWSTGKQHTPLKSLLGEANLETKTKSLNPKQTSTGTKSDENTPRTNDAFATTVNSILGPEAPANQVAKREMGKEWNSPARYPSDNKKEKRKVKGRPYWVPFVCCSSVN